MKSGEMIPTAAGTSVMVPYKGQHPCFGQRQGWCRNMATWIGEGKHVALSFCDECKERDQMKGLITKWTPMDECPKNERN